MTTRLTVVKRDKSIQDFDETKIINAVLAAFEDVYGSKGVDTEIVDIITNDVIYNLSTWGQSKIGIEDIQDMIETSLMRKGYSKVAKQFILYRDEHAKLRKEKEKLLNTNQLTNISKRLSYNSLAVIKDKYLISKVGIDTVTGKKIKIALEQPDDLFERVAKTITISDMLHSLQRSTDGDFVEQSCLPLEDYDETKLGAKFYEQNWALFNQYNLNVYHASRMLYLINQIPDFKISLFESSLDDDFRITKQFAEQFEIFFGNNGIWKKWYNGLANQDFMFNTPVMMNFGRPLGGGNACFVLPMEDDLLKIGDLNSRLMQIYKKAGGLGVNASALRPAGDRVGDIDDAASGPISFLRIIDFITKEIKSGTGRRGANLAGLNFNHPDILEFINCKKDMTTLTNFNISVCLDKEYWNAFFNNESYSLINPRNGEIWGSQNAQSLFDNIAEAAWKSAEPGLLFIDNANKHNPLQQVFGKMEVTNPCVTGDTRLLTSEGMIRMDELYLSGKQLQVATDDRTINRKPEEKGIRLRNAVPVFKTSNSADIYEVITTDGYYVKATNYHKFYIEEKKSKYVKEVSLKELKDLKVGDKLLIQCQEGYFGTQGSKELGAVIGWYQADGYHTRAFAFKNEDKNNVILDFMDKKRELGEMFLNFTNKILPNNKNGNSKQDVSLRDIKGRNCYSITSSRLGDLFKSLNITKNLVPEIIWQGSKDCVVNYLRALFTADGYVNISSHNTLCSIRLSSVNSEFLSQIQQLLSNFGIKCSVLMTKKESKRFLPSDRNGNTQLYNCKPVFDLIITGKNILKYNSEIGFLLQYKQNKLEEYISKHDFSYTGRNEFVSKIKSITYKGKEPVYDTTEFETHTITVNGIVTSQCGEIFLYPNDSCTLASINLANFVTPSREFDFERFKETCKVVTRGLDNVITISKYPDVRIEQTTKAFRRLGLGIMGLADALFKLRIRYDSKEGYEIMEQIAKAAHESSAEQSIDLAMERGQAANWKRYIDKTGADSFETLCSEISGQTNLSEQYKEKARKYGVRNCWTTTEAPTGTISMATGCSSGIEPLFGLYFMKKDRNGNEYPYWNEYFIEALKEEGIYSEQILQKVLDNYSTCEGIEEIPKWIQNTFVTAMSIHHTDHVYAQSVWQRYVNNSISKTINLPASATVEDVKQSYILAHALGCKGISVYRDKSRNEQILHVETKEDTRPLQSSSFVREYIVSNLGHLRFYLPDLFMIKSIITHEDGSTPEIKEYADIVENNAKYLEEYKERNYCQTCQSKLIFQEGCKVCPNCQVSYCNV
ncbi:MAG: ATP cone domain-containing protein [Candidatus Nitrosocosmicus sp.]|nr:ATP cone domain-containing protein [Candidatus Nitrosocosmicus sp.]